MLSLTFFFAALPDLISPLISFARFGSPFQSSFNDLCFAYAYKAVERNGPSTF